ncbi:hypothetical protein J2754_001420 [Halarchaeum solikamskense]|uniref:DUF3592 domain-containing protein n=1 Tax=Halarchaeum nitratireducens TaxID=489913 RepID=UPI001B3AF443|nr:DUF3592 domain-containing protein [Halarchaeum solikamskense]MBP2251099.1 hypothetical protein [Halarchaeum solikamskense]
MQFERPLLVAALLLALFVGGAGYVVHQYQYVDATETTQGTVLTAQVDEYTRVGGIHLTGNTAYDANLTYAYTVGGERFVSHAVFAGPYTSLGNGRHTASVVNRYREGGSVTVHYAPNDPSSSFVVARYGFVPGFLAMALALFLAADFLTPGSRWLRATWRFLTDRSGSRRRRRDDEWNDPDGLREPADTTAQSSVDSGYVTGRLKWGVWAGASAGTLALVALYRHLSAPPYSRLAWVVALVALAAPLIRAGLVYRDRS